MIVVALILTSLGVADILRAYIPGRSGALIAIATGLALVAAYGSLTGIEWWWALIAGLLLVGWIIPSRGNAAAPTAVWLVAAPLATVVAALAFAASQSAESSAIAQWYRSLHYTALDNVGFDVFALAIGCILFLTETSNVMVRLVLSAAKSADRAADEAPADAPAGVRRWRVLLPFRASVGVVAEELRSAGPTSALRGGRIIGPLERLFIFALALAGEFTAIGAVVAAKGIVRFPEISKSSADGSKAEEFLIGSFSSWALVVVAAVLLNLNPVL